MRMPIFLKTGRVRTSWNSQRCSLDTLNNRVQPPRGGIRRRVFRAIHDKCHVGGGGAPSYAPSSLGQM
jgi:hypothetical protein